MLPEDQDGDPAALSDGAFPPVRTAPVDELVELGSGYDPLIGGPPGVVMRSCNLRRIGGLGTTDFDQGGAHDRIEASGQAAFKWDV